MTREICIQTIHLFSQIFISGVVLLLRFGYGQKLTRTIWRGQKRQAGVKKNHWVFTFGLQLGN